MIGGIQCPTQWPIISPPSGLAGGHMFSHVPDYISGQIQPHRKLEMLGITWKCVWDHKIL